MTIRRIFPVGCRGVEKLLPRWFLACGKRVR